MIETFEDDYGIVEFVYDSNFLDITNELRVINNELRLY